MKKSVLLTSMFALACSGAFAQTLSAEGAKMSKMDFKKGMNILDGAKLVDAKLAKANAPKRSLVNGVLYTRPEGSMYMGYNVDGLSYRAIGLCVPSQQNVIFTNASTATGTKWFMQTSSGLVSADRYADENNNLILGYNPVWEEGAYYSVPTLTSADEKTSFTFGEWNTDGAGVMPLGFVAPLASVDDSQGGYVYAQSGFGTENYLIGSGELNGKAGYYLTGILTFHEKPISPLYVEGIHILVHSPTSTPIPAGKTISLTIYGVNAEGDVDSNDEIATLTATSDDYNFIQSGSTNYGSGVINYGTLTFTAKGVDGFGNPTSEPVVLDRAFAMLMTGVDQDGVVFGVSGIEQNNDDLAFINPVSFFVSNSDGDVQNLSYNGTPMNISYQFNGVFDYVEPMESGQLTDGTEVSDINVLRVSADGQTVSNEGLGSQYPYVPVNTAMEWKDIDGNDQYDLSIPEWVSSVEAAAVSEYNGEYGVQILCEPLPAGVEGRAAKVEITGKGYTSKTPIYILQGNATKEDATGIQGVENVKTVSTSRMFNLAGQQVGKDFKGIVVKDGKKFLKK